MSRAIPRARWLRVSAYVMAAISVAAFVTFISISGPVPKAIAYGSNPLFAAYSWAPFISGVAGVLSVVLAVTTLRGSSRGTQVGLMGLAIGILLFFFVTVLAANVLRTAAPPPIEGKGVTTASFPLIVLSPPVIGFAAVAVGAVIALSRLRNVSGSRLTIASLVAGGVVTSFWLLNLLLLNLSTE